MLVLLFSCRHKFGDAYFCIQTPRQLRNLSGGVKVEYHNLGRDECLIGLRFYVDVRPRDGLGPLDSDALNVCVHVRKVEVLLQTLADCLTPDRNRLWRLRKHLGDCVLSKQGCGGRCVAVLDRGEECRNSVDEVLVTEIQLWLGCTELHNGVNLKIPGERCHQARFRIEDELRGGWNDRRPARRRLFHESALVSPLHVLQDVDGVALTDAVCDDGLETHRLCNHLADCSEFSLAGCCESFGHRVTAADLGPDIVCKVAKLTFDVVVGAVLREQDTLRPCKEVLRHNCCCVKRLNVQVVVYCVLCACLLSSC
mmetsp:Transcript_3553/g.10711  ORF Transcript_3553/g.10711 Transcript_3553/m.10711 type:complete len:311 (+) Transcript_3553:573-1505(+)